MGSHSVLASSAESLETNTTMILPNVGSGTHWFISPYASKWVFRTPIIWGWKNVLGNEVTASVFVVCNGRGDTVCDDDEGREILKEAVIVQVG